MVKKEQKLTNLPLDFKKLFQDTLKQIEKFGDTISLAEFTFVSTLLIFETNYEDEGRKKTADSFANIVRETFPDEGYLQKKLAQLENFGRDRIQDLNAQGVIYLWTILESFVKQLIAEFISFDTGILASERFSGVKISIPELYKLDEKEKSTYLADLIIDSLKGSRALGITRFESVLEPFALSGKFDDDHSKNIFAVHQLRNCIVHNASIADKEFVENCPWMKYDIGDKIAISRDELNSYESSVLAYLSEVFYRVNFKLGAPETYLKELREKMSKINKAIDQATKQ